MIDYRLFSLIKSACAPTHLSPRKIRYAWGWSLVIALLLVLLGSMQPAWAVSPPNISPATGTYSTQQNVTMSVSGGAAIYYTTNGSTPTMSSPQFIPGTTPAIPITAPTQINAIALLSGTYSTVTTAYLDVDPALAAVLTSNTELALRLRSNFGPATSSGSPATVTGWTDLSGNPNNLTGTTGSEPTVANRTAGDPVVSFNGSSQYLSVASGATGATYAGCTAFVVTKPNALTASSRILDLGQGSSGNNILLQIASSGSAGVYSTYNGTSGTSVSSASPMLQGQYQLLEAIQNSASPYAGTVYLNSVAGAAVSMNEPSSVTRSSSFLGQASSGGNFYAGNIAELLFYYNQANENGQLSDLQRVNVEAYLLQKYQLLSVLPEQPVISIGNATLTQPTQVVVSSQPGAVIYVTTDGSTPSNSSPVYMGNPIQINYTQTLKAIAIRNGVSSSVASAAYTLNSSQWPAPSPTDMTAPTINLNLPVKSQ